MCVWGENYFSMYNQEHNYRGKEDITYIEYNVSIEK